MFLHISSPKTFRLHCIWSCSHFYLLFFLIHLTLFIWTSCKLNLKQQECKLKLKKSSRSLSAHLKLCIPCVALAQGQPGHDIRVGLTLHHCLSNFGPKVLKVTLSRYVGRWMVPHLPFLLACFSLKFSSKGVENHLEGKTSENLPHSVSWELCAINFFLV